MSKTFEAWWDCERCGTKGHGALTHRECPECGAGQSGKRYAPPKNQRVAAVNDGRGPDWACHHCGTYNPVMDKHCRSCAAPKGSSPTVPITPTPTSVPRTAPKAFRPEPTVVPRVEPTVVPPRPRPQVQEERRTQAPQWTPPVRREPVVEAPMSNSINPVFYIAPAVALAVAGIITCAVWKKDVEAEVQGHTWQRQIQIETLTSQHDSTWCNELPAGAILTGTPIRAVRRHEQRKSGESCETVPAHYVAAPPCDKTPVCVAAPPDCIIDHGNGTMSECEPKCTTPKCPEGRQVAAVRTCTPHYEDVPIFGDKCTFVINRWVAKDTWEEAKGSDLNPFWPNVAMQTCSSPEQVGCQRIAQRKERYEVRLRDEDGKSFPCDFHEQHWRTFSVGSRWMTVENIMGTPDCSKMKTL